MPEKLLRKTLDDLGDLASDELIELLGDKAPNEEQANELIMAARAHWFEGEEPAADEANGDEAAGDEAAGEESADAETTEAETGEQAG